MESLKYVTDHFLVCLSEDKKDFFYHTVVYICEHSKEGAFGFVINKSSDMAIANLPIENNHKTFFNEIMTGGPVQAEKMCVLYQKHIEDKETVYLALLDDFFAKEKLADIKYSMIFSGLCAWTPLQLEKEIERNIWLAIPSKAALIFECPDDRDTRWQAAFKLMGFSPEQFFNIHYHVKL